MATPDEYIRTQAILRRWIQSVLQDTGTGQDLAVALQDGMDNNLKQSETLFSPPQLLPLRLQ